MWGKDELRHSQARFWQLFLCFLTLFPEKPWPYNHSPEPGGILVYRALQGAGSVWFPTRISQH